MSTAPNPTTDTLTISTAVDIFFGDLRLAHQVGEAVFQNAGAHPGEHVFTAVPLEHDRLDALKMQKLRQHQSRRTAPDNPYLRAHFRAPEFRSITVLYLRSFL